MPWSYVLAMLDYDLVIDGDVENHQPVADLSPREVVAAAYYIGYPIIVGINHLQREHQWRQCDVQCVTNEALISIVLHPYDVLDISLRIDVCYLHS